MSFILDAIAKSEQERQQQEVPGARILALPVGGLPKSRSVLPYFVVGALLLNAVVLVLWMQSGQTFLNWLSPTQIEAKDQRVEQFSGLDSVSAIDPTILPETKRNKTVTAIEPTAPMNEPLVAQPGKTQTIASEAVEVFATEPETSQSESAESTSEGTTAWKRIEPGTLLNDARFGQSANPVQDNRAVQSRVSTLGELPKDVRRDLPTVIFSGHLYSSNPKSSVVFVDQGRPVMTGLQIVDEVYLREITPTGVVVEFRGYLIDVGVLQNWTLN
ncbi:MAG: general secretion pathway protein B [Gammaproteobacteria bacterium]|jgi:general secretion pathway protein B